MSYVRGRGSHRGDFSQFEKADTQYDDYVKIIFLSSNHVVLFFYTCRLLLLKMACLDSPCVAKLILWLLNYDLVFKFFVTCLKQLELNVLQNKCSIKSRTSNILLLSPGLRHTSFAIGSNLQLFIIKKPYNCVLEKYCNFLSEKSYFPPGFPGEVNSHS